MRDEFARDINYLRISVTDRCNLRCVYCMPPEGVSLAERDTILRNEEFLTIIRVAVKTGIRKIRLTGGEPLVRKGIVDLVREIGSIPAIDDIALTTNGVLLPQFAFPLKKAGLKRVNISLDTLKPERFREITRNGEIGQVWAGIRAARRVGLKPIKLNVVVIRGFNDDEIMDFINLTKKMPLHVRFIELMPIGASDCWAADKMITVPQIRSIIAAGGVELEPAKPVAGSGPAKYYRVPGAAGTVGFISAISDHFCGSCNRLRLTSEGQLRPCLQSPVEVDLRTPLRAGCSEDELAALINRTVAAKPEKHTMVTRGWDDNNRMMSQIGG
ncbi:MAG: GTP 3',8-cyclase MoaA [Bacillota bacterium]